MINILLIFSAFIGQGLRYGKVYLFHIIFLVATVWTLRTWRASLARIRTLPPRILWSLGAFLGWSLLSFVWSPNHGPWLTRFLQIALVMGLPLLLVANADPKRRENRVMCVMIGLHFLISYLEMFEIVRWPISKFSEPLLDPLSRMAENAPTSFFWNQNPCAFATLLLLPFVRVLSRWNKIIFLSLAFFVIYMSGSKVALIGYVVYVWYIIFTHKEIPLKIKLTSLILPILIYKLIIWDDSPLRKSKLLLTGTSLQEYALSVKKCMLGEGADVSDLVVKSVQQRMLMLCDSYEKIKSSPVVGSGLSQNSGTSRTSGAIRYSLDTIHQFWVEILMDQGMIGLAIFGSWFVWTLVFFHRQTAFEFRDSLILFFFFVPMISTAYYFLLFYLIIGLGYLKGLSGEREKA